MKSQSYPSSTRGEVVQSVGKSGKPSGVRRYIHTFNWNSGSVAVAPGRIAETPYASVPRTTGRIAEAPYASASVVPTRMVETSRAAVPIAPSRGIETIRAPVMGPEVVVAAGPG